MRLQHGWIHVFDEFLKKDWTWALWTSKSCKNAEDTEDKEIILVHHKLFSLTHFMSLRRGGGYAEGRFSLIFLVSATQRE